MMAKNRFRQIFKSKQRVLKRSIGLMTILFLGLTSCVHRSRYTVIRPLSPVPDKEGYAWVDSVNPTLCWKLSRGTPSPDMTFDLVIYEKGPRDRNYYPPKGWIYRKQVYYRDGLKETEHRVEITLEPQRRYLWTVPSGYESLSLGDH
ncbi:MAG: hypothetical protein JXA73_25940 [Acidobacteria bacterium]|nr:hypothetical protein [Acidobacteriota bacterium]